MGFNKVGGKRRKTVRRYKHRGGALMESLNMRAFPMPSYSTAPPNFTQVVNNAYAGVPPFPSASPVDHTWKYSQVANTPINPGSITPITGNFNQLAFSTST
jgi:hypothetical protein